MSWLAEQVPGILVGAAVGSALVSLWEIGDGLRDIARAIRSLKGPQ